MNTLRDRLRNAQSDVAAFAPVIVFTYRKYSGLIREQIANLVPAQIPHRSKFGNGVMPLSVCRSRWL